MSIECLQVEKRGRHTAASKTSTGTPSLARATAHVNPQTPPPTIATLKSFGGLIVNRGQSECTLGYLICPNIYLGAAFASMGSRDNQAKIIFPCSSGNRLPTAEQYYVVFYWAYHTGLVSAPTIRDFRGKRKNLSAVLPSGVSHCSRGAGRILWYV